jgi:hypothetical protein
MCASSVSHGIACANRSGEFPQSAWHGRPVGLRYTLTVEASACAPHGPLADGLAPRLAFERVSLDHATGLGERLVPVLDWGLVGNEVDPMRVATIGCGFGGSLVIHVAGR